MKDQDKTKERLVNELVELRQRVTELEATDTERRQVEEELARKAQELAHSNALTGALGRVTARIQTTPDPDQVMETLGAELKQLGIHCLVGLLDLDNQALVGRYISVESKALAQAEKLLGFKIRGYRMPLERMRFHSEIVEQKRAVFAPDAISMMDDFLPGLPRQVRGQLLRLSGVPPGTPAFYLPLVIKDRVIGVLNLWSKDLQERDLPAFSVFASQVAIAMENARLYEMAQQEITERKRAEEALRKAHDELEIRVQERTAELTKVNEELRIEIAERKRAEEVVRREKLLGDSIVDNAPAGVAFLDNDFALRRCNHTYAELIRTYTPYTPEQALGMSYFDYAAGSRPQVEEWFQKVRDTGQVDTRYGFKLVLKRDGQEETTYWDTSVAPVLDAEGKAEGILVLTQDVTERKRAEEALRESEERYRQLVELSPDTIAVHSEGKIIFMNTAGAKLLGAANPEQLIGRPIMDFLHPDYRDIVKQRVRWIGKEGKEASLIEEKFIRLDGTVIDVEVAAFSFTYQGKPAVQAVTRDITDRKRAEEALKEYSERLEEMVEERTKELRDAQARLIQSEKLAATGRLAVSVAHEINNPLQGISNYLSLISQQVAEDDSLHENLEMVKLGFERISEIVRRLRAFHRPVGEGMESTDINGVVERALALVGYQLSLGQVEVRTELAEQELLVLGSAGQLEQVLINLALNAQEAMPQGGELIVRTTLRQDMVQVQVSDTGHGIGEEEMSRLFKPFYGKEGGQGLGLGLWISHNIIEGHGGGIEVESQVGEGSTFTISLPAYQRER